MNIPCIIHPKKYKLNMKQHFHREASTENIDLNVQNARRMKNNSSHLQTAFQHPLSNSYIYSILDPSHMIKLCRNTFAECKITYENREIFFAYVKKLHDIQEEKGLKLANKLGNAHIHYFSKKMNVSLASQTISSNVTDAIDYLRKIKT